MRNVVGKNVACPLFLTVILLAAPAPAAAWNANVHQRIARDALALLPAEMKARLEGGAGDLESGIIYPDVYLQDFDNHYCCPDGTCGHAPAKVGEAFEDILADFPGKGVVRFLAALASLLPVGCSGDGGPSGPESDNLPLRLGIVAHYLSDVSSPLHTTMDPLYEDRHSAIEAAIDRRVDDIVLTFDGALTDMGGDPAGFVVAAAVAASADLPLLQDFSGGALPDGLMPMIDRRYSRAVNGVADLWYSLLSRLK